MCDRIDRFRHVVVRGRQRHTDLPQLPSPQERKGLPLQQVDQLGRPGLTAPVLPYVIGHSVSAILRAPQLVDMSSLLGYFQNKRVSENKMQTSPPKPRLHLVSLLVLCLGAALCRANDDITLLVATPQLEGSVFEESVILVAPHDNGAAMGVILNRPMPVDASQMYPEDDLLSGAGVIHFGGPVNPGVLIFLFRSDETYADALHLFDDVYFSRSRELLALQMRRPRVESGLQLFMGYSGWAIGQLQAEIVRGSWSTVKATSSHLFSKDRATLWHTLSGRSHDKWI